MKYASEILAIIEGGLECNEEKVRAYTKLLLDKIPIDEEHKMIRRAIWRRLDGSYKSDPTMHSW